MNRDEFLVEVCRSLGWEPTPWRIAAFNEWARLEGMPFEPSFNPLATTRLSPTTPLNLSFDIGFGPGCWNSVPVRVYRDAEAGIAATVETLRLDYYPNIRRCFADETGHEAAIPEFATYVGSDAYGRDLVAFMRSLAPSQPMGPSLEERVARLERLVGGNGVDANGRRLSAQPALAWLDAEGMSLFLGLANTQLALAQLQSKCQACTSA